MNDEKLSQRVKKAVLELGIDVPVMAVKPIGDEKVELSLYGGRVVTWPGEKALTPDPSPNAGRGGQDLEKLDVATLRLMAKEKGIGGAGGMKKAEIIAALKGAGA